MTNTMPEEIKEIREYFEKFEKTTEISEIVEYFEGALHKIDVYLTRHRRSHHKKYLSNLKVAYTKRLIEKASRLPGLNLSVWHSFIELFLIVKSEVEKIVYRNRDLKNKYSIFIEMYLQSYLNDKKQADSVDPWAELSERWLDDSSLFRVGVPRDRLEKILIDVRRAKLRKKRKKKTTRSS